MPLIKGRCGHPVLDDRAEAFLMHLRQHRDLSPWSADELWLHYVDWFAETAPHARSIAMTKGQLFRALSKSDLRPYRVPAQSPTGKRGYRYRFVEPVNRDAVSDDMVPAPFFAEYDQTHHAEALQKLQNLGIVSIVQRHGVSTAVIAPYAANLILGQATPEVYDNVIARVAKLREQTDVSRGSVSRASLIWRIRNMLSW